MLLNTEDIDPQSVFGFWKNLALIIIFITLTPVALATSLFSLYSISKDQVVQQEISTKKADLIDLPRSGVRIYASLPTEPRQVSESFETADARAVIIKDYLARYNSPVVDLADYIVTTSDKYALDYRLLTAIAQQESNLCKRIPENTYNCWGWGIHSKGTLGFDSFEEGIETVAKGLRTEYIDKGYVTVGEIMDKWVPHSPERAWEKGVTAFMEDMQ